VNIERDARHGGVIETPLPRDVETDSVGVAAVAPAARVKPLPAWQGQLPRIYLVLLIITVVA
jgi:hypothetical protein